MLIIPAIDIIDGKCVRLQKGDYSLISRYENSPLEQAKYFEEMGYKNLHLVDLDGALLGKPMNLNVLNDISLNTNLLVDYGGGLRTYEDTIAAFNAGASQVNLGTILISNPDFASEVLLRFGSKKLIASVDCNNNEVKTHGWQSGSGLDIIQAIKSLLNSGFRNFTVTEISKDGMLEGPAFELYKTLKGTFPTINLRASGGVSSQDDINKLEKLNLEGVVVGKMFYEQNKQL
ncbi:MAG: HisA/HisF-related TIM barrel protein [Tenuifilaceae bacterium]